MIRVLIVDDHTILRQGIRRMLSDDPALEVAGEAASGTEAVRLAAELRPDVIVMDIAMPGLNGVEATAQIGNLDPGIAVLILTRFSDERNITRAIEAGARGYLLKDAPESELLRAIHAVHQRRAFPSPGVAKALRDDGKTEEDDHYLLLTERERQVYAMLAEARSNKDVAGLLGISQHTVETHRVRIMEKLGLHSGAELVLSAVRRGLVF